MPSNTRYYCWLYMRVLTLNLPEKSSGTPKERAVQAAFGSKFAYETSQIRIRGAIHSAVTFWINVYTSPSCSHFAVPIAKLATLWKLTLSDDLRCSRLSSPTHKHRALTPLCVTALCLRKSRTTLNLFALVGTNSFVSKAYELLTVPDC